MNNDTMSRHKDKDMGDQQVAVVTGGSSGMGYETSLTLARNGFYVSATVWKLDQGIEHITDIAMKKNLPLQVIQLDDPVQWYDDSYSSFAPCGGD